MIEIEITQDEIYYWLIFTVFFSSLSVIGATIFVISYKIMICLRSKRLKQKVHYQYKLMPDMATTESQNFNETN